MIDKLTSLMAGSPADLLYQASLTNGADLLQNLIRDARVEEADAQTAIDKLFDDGKLTELKTGYVMATPQWETLQSRAVNMVTGYHESFPLRRGVPREELKSRLKIDAKLFSAMLKKLVEAELLVEAGKTVSLLTHNITFGNKEQALLSGLMRRFEANPFSPPTVKESIEEVGEEIFNALLEIDELVGVSAEVVFCKKDYDKMLEMLREYIAEHRRITVADARDLYGTSRRYVLAFFEHLDTQRVTRREGDYRILN